MGLRAFMQNSNLPRRDRWKLSFILISLSKPHMSSIIRSSSSTGGSPLSKSFGNFSNKIFDSMKLMILLLGPDGSMEPYVGRVVASYTVC